MEKIKKELQDLVNLNSDKNKVKELNEKIKEKKNELDNLKNQVQLQISGTPLRDIAEEKLEVAKKEFEKMEEDNSKNQKELTEKFEEYKSNLMSKIEEEMKKYKRKSELDNLKSSKNAYERVADNAEKTVKRLISDFNDGKNIDQSMLISARKEMNSNRERAEKVEEELKGYIEIDSNVEQYSDLEYLKIRMQGLTLEQLNEKTEEKFYKKYFENTKTEQEKTETEKKEQEKVEQEETETEKKEPEKTEQEKTETEKKEPEKTEQEKTETEKKEPENPKPTKTEPPIKRNINNIKIIAFQDKICKKPILRFYDLNDKQEYLDNGKYEFEKTTKEAVIKDVLKLTYGENNIDEEEIAKYEKADPNIVNLLKGNKERLEEYRDFLNGVKKRDKKDKDALTIVYDIRKLSKSDIPDDAKRELEACAYEHRHIAKVKKNFSQTISFAWKAFKERMENSKKTKTLESGKDSVTNPQLEENSNLKEDIQKAIDKNKSMNRYQEIAKRANEEFLNQTDSWKKEFKVDNTNNKEEDSKLKEDIQKAIDKNKTMNKCQENAKRANEEFLNQTDSWKKEFKVDNTNNKIEANATENKEEASKTNESRQSSDKDLSE